MKNRTTRPNLKNLDTRKVMAIDLIEEALVLLKNYVRGGKLLIYHLEYYPIKMKVKQNPI